MTESEIEKQILEYLKFRGVMCWKDRQQPRQPKKGNVRSAKGVPDIIGILSDGKFLGIEVKKPGGSLSDSQKEFLYEANRRSAVSIVAYSLEDVIEFFEDRKSF